MDYVGMLNEKCDDHREASPIFPPNVILVGGKICLITVIVGGNMFP